MAAPQTPVEALIFAVVILVGLLLLALTDPIAAFCSAIGGEGLAAC